MFVDIPTNLLRHSVVVRGLSSMQEVLVQTSSPSLYTKMICHWKLKKVQAKNPEVLEHERELDKLMNHRGCFYATYSTRLHNWVFELALVLSHFSEINEKNGDCFYLKLTNMHEIWHVSKFASNGGIATVINVEIKGKWMLSFFFFFFFLFSTKVWLFVILTKKKKKFGCDFECINDIWTPYGHALIIIIIFSKL